MSADAQVKSYCPCTRPSACAVGCLVRRIMHFLTSAACVADAHAPQLVPGTNAAMVCQVYKKDAATSYRPSNKDASDPKWSVHDNAKLFSLECQSYDVLVRKLAYALLLLVQEPTLSMCQHMIVRKAELAELMLPHILADIACHSTDSSLMPAISTQLASNLLSPSTARAMHIKATQLILTCLDHLRNMHVNAVLGLDPGRAVRSSGAATQGRSRSTRQASQGDGVGSPVQWQKRYWLDVDYLLVAAAALRCSAYFTALLYVEHWIEDEYGRLTLTDAPQDNKVIVLVPRSVSSLAVDARKLAH